jgi:hypothetical protein
LVEVSFHRVLIQHILIVFIRIPPCYLWKINTRIGL